MCVCVRAIRKLRTIRVNDHKTTTGYDDVTLCMMI